jgi:hypothetical protein
MKKSITLRLLLRGEQVCDLDFDRGIEPLTWGHIFPGGLPSSWSSRMVRITQIWRLTL